VWANLALTAALAVVLWRHNRAAAKAALRQPATTHAEVTQKAA
jgi:hypothetical protein